MDNPDNSRLYTIQPVAGKGLGLVATSNIPKGTRFISETPILFFDRGFNQADQLEAYVKQKLDALSPEHKAYFYSLHYNKAAENKEYDILRTNSLPAGAPRTESPDVIPQGIFLDACRINHDCKSNAQFNWNRNLKQLTVHAIRDIAKGDEITVTYNYGLRTSDTRREGLLKGFNFVCTCATCSLPSALLEKSDYNRTWISAFEKYAYTSSDLAHSPLRYLRTLRMLHNLLILEDVQVCNLDWVYYLAFECSVFHGDDLRAEQFINRAATSRSFYAGEEDHLTIQYRELWKDPKKHERYQHEQHRVMGWHPLPRTLASYGEEVYGNWLWRARPDNVGANFASGLPLMALEELPDEDSFYDMLDNNMFPPRYHSHWCFMAEVVQVKDSTHVRHIVKDVANQQHRVDFRSDQEATENPLLNAKPGETVAFLYPKRLIFEDESVGIRVSDPSLIKVFNISFQDLGLLLGSLSHYSTEKLGERVCHGCNHPGKARQACSGCSLFWYCDKKCQKLGWTARGHGKDCKVLRDSDLKKLLLMEWSKVSGDRLKFPL